MAHPSFGELAAPARRLSLRRPDVRVY